MKRILGLDLGVASIGWALVEENETEKIIIDLGSRIIPLSTDDKDEFSSGNKISKNQKRTTKRTQRKGYDRYQLRRKVLIEELKENNMLPDENLIKLPAVQLWNLRAKAVLEKITLQELGRILLHLNQKRGYKSSRSDANLDKKDTEYVADVKNRHQELIEKGITIGQKFYAELQHNEFYKIKQQVFPREAYIEEFDAICNEQKKHQTKLSDELISIIRNEIIYYQRKLKSQKGLVNVCEFEGFTTKDKNGKDIFAGPKVAPKSSPIFQVCKNWETINTISITNKRNENYKLSLEEKIAIFNYLEVNERISETELFKLLDIKKSDGWNGNKNVVKGLQGNLTKTKIASIIGIENPLLKFDLITETSETETYLVDKKTGEILNTNTKKIINAKIEQEPLYQLWHTIYSINDIEECVNALIKKFNFDIETAQKLASIDFTKSAFGNKSTKAMRKTLPYLIEGFIYSDACSYAGYNHSNSLTKDENANRTILDIIPLLQKNSLRQPIVEKILNQLINVVNAIIEKHGKPTEIRIELARELKQSKDERNETFSNLSKRERENQNIRKYIEEDYKKFGVRATRNTIIKWRLYHEMNNNETKLNAMCIYCGKPFSLTDALTGKNIDVEHIIPKSLLFDDSQSNKTLSHRSCNTDKNNVTAYDYMQRKGDAVFYEYLERVEHLYKNKIIGRRKKNNLLTSNDKIPKDFIERQLRETQYIAKKAKQILEQVCTNVWSTSGSVTEHLRRVWGWSDVLMNLQLPKYKQLGLTEIKTWESNGHKHEQEVIKDWSKRDDHRHHAIDALTIACTQQGFIQKINTLNAEHTRDEMFAAIKDTKYNEKLSLLDKYMISQRPFTTAQIEEKAANILISFKAGKKVATIGKRIIKKNGKKTVVQTNIIVPRGALSEEYIYGKIKKLTTNATLKDLFENPDKIVKKSVKDLILQRLEENENDEKKALQSVKKNPIYYDEKRKITLAFGSMYKDEFVIKYPVQSITVKDLKDIVDKGVREAIETRLSQFDFNPKKAFENIDKNPVWFNEEKKIPIKTVRLFTGLSAVEPIKKDVDGNNIGFAKPGNNHHIAIYIDENGKKQEHICTFWHAVERKKNNIPIIIKNPKEIWNTILENPDNYDQSFLEKLPNANWTFDVSLQQNEMFILGLTKEEFENASESNHKNILSNHLYRVQKMATTDYVFRHHLETQIIDTAVTKLSNRYYRITSIIGFEKLNPIKVKINNLGEISLA